MDAIQTKQSTSFFPLIQHFENLPVCVYAAYKQILITANEPFRAITNEKSQFVLGGKKKVRKKKGVRGHHYLRLYLTFVIVVSSFLGVKFPKKRRL